jgi:hypothetical protein
MRIGKLALITARDFWVFAGSLSYRQNSICVVRPQRNQRDQFGGRRRHIEMQLRADSTPQLSDSARKQRILEKIRRRLETLQIAKDASFCKELNPDVIVISDDTSLLFEPQNLQATEWLRRRFGLNGGNLTIRDRIRVHPCQRRGFIAELKTAGFEVVF